MTLLGGLPGAGGGSRGAGVDGGVSAGGASLEGPEGCGEDSPRNRGGGGGGGGGPIVGVAALVVDGAMSPFSFEDGPSVASELDGRLDSLARSTRRARFASRARLSVSPRCNASRTVSPRGRPGAEGEGICGAGVFGVAPPTGSDG